MALTPFIGANLSVTSPQLLRWINVTPSAFGAATGGTLGTYDGSHYAYRNSFIRFAGKLYFIQRGAIYSSRDDGQTWTAEASHTDNANNLGNPGLYVVYVSGVSYLVAAFWNTANVIMRVSQGDGNWTAVTSLGAVSTRGVQTFPYRDRLCYTDGATIRFFNPATSTYSSVALPSGVLTSNEGFSIWNDKIWFAYCDTSGNLRVRYIEGSVVITPPNDLIVGGLNTTNYSTATWVDPTTDELIILNFNFTGAGTWRAYSYPNTLAAATNRTSTMLTGGALAAFTGSTPRLRAVIVDQRTNLGGAPEIYVAICSNTAAGNTYSLFKYNGTGALMGDGAGAATDTGGDTQYGLISGVCGGERFYTARLPGVDAPPTVQITARGTPTVPNTIRRFYQAFYPRSEVLTTIGGSPATHDLSTTPIVGVPIQAKSVTIRGVISATTYVAQDDGAGAFPVSTLLPSGGTINYASGAMTGTTASLDAATNVEALFNGGTADVQIYRTGYSNEYPTNSTPVTLSSPSEGTISGGSTNAGVPADGTTCEITVDMTGFSPGDRFSLIPKIA